MKKITLLTLLLISSFCFGQNTDCAGSSSGVQQGAVSDPYTYSFETLASGDVRMTFELGTTVTGLVAYAWREAPFAESPMTVTGNAATIDLTGLSAGDTISYGVKFVWAAGGFAVTQYFSYTVGDDCVAPNTACAGSSNVVQQGTVTDPYTYSFETLASGDVRMTFELGTTVTGLVAYAWRQAPFAESPMTVTGNAATIDLTGLSAGDTISYGVKFVWAAGGFAVTQYFSYTVGDDCTGPPPVTYTVSVDVSENPGGVNIVTNFSGSWAEVAATSMGNNVFSYTFTNVGAGVTMIEYVWKTYFADGSNAQEGLVSLPGGGGLENHVAASIPANEALLTDYSNYCNRTVRPDGVGFDAQTYYFNSFRVPGVAYSSVSVTAPAGDNIVMDYSVNNFDQYHGPGTTDNGDGTHTAIIDPSADFVYKWNNLTTPAQEDLSACVDSDLIANDGTNSNRKFIANTASVDDVFGVCPTVAGLEDFAANAVKMYPNPAKGFVNFSSASNAALDVSVYDMLGKQVLRAEAVQSQLNISSLNPGMYFVKMTQGSNSSTKKLVVK